MFRRLNERDEIIKEVGVSFWAYVWKMLAWAIACIIALSYAAFVFKIKRRAEVVYESWYETNSSRWSSSDGTATYIGIIAVGVLACGIIYFALKAQKISYSYSNLYATVGILRTREIVIPLDQVTSVSVSNGLIGKLLEYGKIRIASPSGSVYFQRINSPFDFTMDLMEQVEKRKADSKNMLQQGVQQAAGQSAGTQAGSIKCISGVNMGAVVPVAAGERIIIGRDPAFSHFIIKDNRISKKHCIIAFDGGSDKYIVRDVSMNGVYLENGTRLEAGTNVKLSHGTAIRIGKSDNVYKLI